jgi:hypothetical protein
MNDKKRKKMLLIQNALRKERRLFRPLVTRAYKGDIFTEIDDVTVKIGRSGGIEIPAIRSYLDPPDAVVNARKYFGDQQERDQANPKAAAFKTVHFNPRFDQKTGRCFGELKCPRCK